MPAAWWTSPTPCLRASMSAAARQYAAVTAAYFLFTVTDGAIRMLVLLHFYRLGYTSFMLAVLFLLCETAGIFANLGGGWLAARFGIPRMLAVGIGLQIAGLVFLSALDPAWNAGSALTWVVAAQGVAGVAKDFDESRVEERHQGNFAAGRRRTVPLGCVVHRIEERHERTGVFRRRPAVAAVGFAPRCG